MIFWVGIFVGALFAHFAIKMGFYETWAMLFNIVISIYLAIFLRPLAAQLFPAACDMPYGVALTLISIAVASFLILHTISYTFITGQFTVSFPKIFNSLGAGFLGFLAGFLTWSFVALLVCVTPLSHNTFVKQIGFGTQFEQSNVSYVCWWSNLVDRVVSSRDKSYTTEKVIRELLKSAEKTPTRKGVQPQVTDPNKPTDANDTQVR